MSNWHDESALTKMRFEIETLDQLVEQLHNASSKKAPDPALCRRLFDLIGESAERGELAASWGQA